MYDQQSDRVQNGASESWQPGNSFANGRLADIGTGIVHKAERVGIGKSSP